MNKQLIAAAALLVTAAGAQAAAVVGGSSLLTASYADQLQNWLGQGAITLSSLYVKKEGDTALDFHAAADGQGATFTVMVATSGYGNTALIGGYNKDSWYSPQWGEYALNYDLGNGASNFVFNLTTGVKKDQVMEYSTYNSSSYGPTFGGGHDIYVDRQLSSGYSYGYSYGGHTSNSLVDESSYWSSGWMTIGALEVFSISSGVSNAEVPEPGTLALVGLALAAVGVARRRRG